MGENGIFYIIIPDYLKLKFSRLMDNSGFHKKSELKIKTFQHEAPLRVIFGYTRNPLDIEESYLVIHAPDKSYTQAFRELLKDFYLAF